MRKIRIVEHISLDGVIQPGGPKVDSDYAHGGWIAPYRTAEGAAAVAEAYGKGCNLLLGRRTYDLWAALLAEDQERSVREQSESRDEIRRDPQAEQSQMGTGRGSRSGRYGGYSPTQVTGRP